ncbi:hypothetical protein BGV71_31730 [Burkholderia ubonensis]|uniref:hypothetical protein n=1 Tax=Burkholderia ubonensis TaxID=101571 RepID=UPI0008FDC229|nr:hypothetical protein [Burkholderia ubonensis]OJA66555.1 hypothetical protein BGV71_31730 [Burkholderia ubonensis]
MTTITNESSKHAPAGMVEVSKEQFYDVMGPLDVHPRAEPDRSVWETPQRAVIGISMPGYLTDYGQPEQFFLMANFA